MPLYYFSTTQEGRHDDRDDPIELQDDDVAWGQATAAFGELLKEINGNLKPNIECRLDVKDTSNKLIYSLRLMPSSFR